MDVIKSEEPKENSQPGEISKGLECKACGCHHFNCDKTVHAKNRIVRYRYCRNCGKRVVTSERIIEG